MNSKPDILIELYRRFLKLYPVSFRNEFEEEMIQDFSNLAADAKTRGDFAFFLFCFRELIDFPVNLLKVHVKHGQLFKILGSQPARTGLRTALGFGIGFAVVAIATWQISHWLFLTLDPWIQHWSIWYYDKFRTEGGIFIFQNILMFFSTVLTGLVFGLVFAFLLGRSSSYLRYMLVGTLGFIMSNSVSFVFSEVFGWSLDLSPGQSSVLIISLLALTGTFWGAICTLLDDSHKALLRILATGTILYPLSTFLFIKLLFVFRLELTPWFFLSLMFFILLLFSGMFIVALRHNRKIPWMMIAAAVGYPGLYYGIFYIAYDILRLPSPEPGVGISPEAFVVYQLNHTVVEAVIGVMFGLLLGVIWGYQRKNLPSELVSGL